MRKPVKNIGASIRGRLLNLAKERNQPLDLLLTRYALERFLYRLSLSRHRDRFVLKGAMLLASTMHDPHRPTRDLDLLGFGERDPGAMIETVREICAIEADDAVVFDLPGLAVDSFRNDTEYGGLRIKTRAVVDGAGVRVLIDIGFGDAIEPGSSTLIFRFCWACRRPVCVHTPTKR
jgi:Nucleotidyl transferase AbiEii toxin, Type IV TA system